MVGNYVFSILYTGVVLGSIFAISAVGLALIYGTLRFLNLAHGGFIVIGGYMAWLTVERFDMPVFVGLVVAMVSGSLVGLITYVAILRPLLGSSKWATSTIIASVGLAIIIQAVVLLLFGPRLKALPPAIEGNLIVGTTVVKFNSLLIGVIAVLLLLGTHFFLKYSRSGVAVRAVAGNLQAAYLMGIPAGRAFAITAAISGALAAAAGVLLGSFMLLRPSGGLDPMLTAIAVVVLGGLGSTKGTIIAAYVIGFIQAAVAVVFGVKWGLPALYAFMIVVLIFRPYGLYGTPEETRV